MNGSPTGDPGSGGLHVAGEIVANGGSIAQGGSGNGADGGRVDIELKPTDGAVMVDQGGEDQRRRRQGGRRGRRRAAAATSGCSPWTAISRSPARSPRAAATGPTRGTGGLGGMIYFFSDNNHNAVDVGKGNLLIAATGKLDASGGNGAIGGSARNDGIGNGSVAPFPEEQEKFAIFLNCDGQHGETHNWMKNDGILIARGGVHNGNGGDITYHGIGPGQLGMDTDGSGNHHPPPGNQDMSGDGTGMPGDYGGE